MRLLVMFSLLFILIFPVSVQADFKVTILYDNYVHTKGTQSDWGFSCLVEGNGENVLFDVGTKADVLAKNAQILQIDFKTVKKLVISHNHGDHFGGISAFLKNNQGVIAYIPPDLVSEVVQSINSAKGKVLKNIKATEISKGIITTGIMGKSILEHGIILQTGNRNVLITGCAHPKIVDIIKRGKEIVKGNIDVVFGGFHLFRTSNSQILKIVEMFRTLGVKQVGATHCTGDPAIEAFKQEYKEDFLQMGVGKVLEFK